MSRAVVTGGAGFVGAHLCRALSAAGWDVVAVDDFSTGTPDAVADLVERPGFTLVEHNVIDGLPIEGSVEAVLHLASPASPLAYLARPLETLAVGSAGTRHALELAAAQGARFLLASTSEVYGDPAVHPQPESYWGNVNPVGPRSVYDESKRFAEATATAYAATRGVDVRIARIFNTYGPGMNATDGRVVVNFLAQALAGKPLTVYGDGTQTRSFCFVDDLVRGLVLLLQSEVTGPVNLGNPDERTILDLVELVRELTGSNSEISFLPLPESDPVRRCPDITRSRRELGWSADISLRDGLGRMVAAMREEPSG